MFIFLQIIYASPPSVAQKKLQQLHDDEDEDRHCRVFALQFRLREIFHNFNKYAPILMILGSKIIRIQRKI